MTALRPSAVATLTTRVRAPVSPSHSGRAVMIGSAYLWDLAAGGKSGVENVIDILRGGIDSALLGLGHSSVQDLSADDLVIADGFRHDLGA